jgi:hypothetical protein
MKSLTTMNPNLRDSANVAKDIYRDTVSVPIAVSALTVAWLMNLTVRPYLKNTRRVEIS